MYNLGKAGYNGSMHSIIDPLEQRLYRLPALFFLDHEDRSPCDRPEQMAELMSIHNRIAFVMANDEQLENLRSDAEFYAEGNVDGCLSLVRSAKATLEAIKKHLKEMK
jgi:hypothetical protein